jgi:trimeric autotransporter adhesin
MISKMKTKLFLTVLLSFSFYHMFSQIPQGFNYQAIARDGSGNPIVGGDLVVELSIQADTSATPVILWKEQFSGIKTNAFGLFAVVIGQGTRIAGALTFNAVNWSVTPLYLRTMIKYNNVWRYMGSSKLWSVPYAIAANNLLGTVNKLNVAGTDTSMSSALFEVKNNNGQTIFAVYNEGVRVYVDDGKGLKGGFAIGSFGTGKAASQEFFRVTRDSTRVYVNQAAKGLKGGFAIGGFSTGKGNDTTNFMNLTRQNYFIGQQAGYSNNTGLFNSFIGYKSGYSNSVGNFNTMIGYETGLGSNADYNTFLGFQAGRSTVFGGSNVFMGYKSGYLNISGYRNVFLGYNSGQYNTSGYENTFVGGHSGYGFNSGNANVMIGTYAGNYLYGGNSNIFIGNRSGYGIKNTTTLADSNIFIGTNTGSHITTGYDNTFIGSGSGSNISTGYYNVFVGNRSGFSNSTGYNNIFIGYLAGENSNSTTNSTFIGNAAGRNITGDDNISIGDNSGTNAYTSVNEMFGITILGIDAGRNMAGNYNTFLGYGTGSKWGSAGTGNNNTFVGSGAGGGGSASLTDNNVCLGYNAGADASGSNKLFIANSAAKTLIYGEFDNKKLKFDANVGINVDQNTYKLHAVDDRITNDYPAILGQHNVTAYYGIGVKGIGGYVGVWGEANISGSSISYGVFGSASGGGSNYGVYGTASGTDSWSGYFNGNVKVIGSVSQTSDKNLKKNIVPLSGALKKVMELQGISFEWKTESELASAGLINRKGTKEPDNKSFNFPEGTQLGVIAQDVEKIVPELVSTEADGLKSVDYIKMIPLLIEAIKDQQKQIEELKNQVSKLSGQVNK